MNSKQEIVVGLSISLTGRFSFQGQQALDGIRLWEYYIAAEGGITVGAEGRRPVRLIYYDDESRVRRAQQNALRLLRKDRVEVLLGPYSSGLTMAVAQVAEENRKLLWNHGGSSDEIFNRSLHYLVTTASPASDYLRGLPHWLATRTLPIRRICVLHSSKGSFASQVVRGIVEAVRSIGLHSVELVPLKSPLRNVDVVVRELRSIGPEVLVLAGSFQDEVRIMQARHLWPDMLKEVVAVAAGVQAFYQKLKQGAERVIGPSQWEPQVRFREIQGPNSNWFVRNFRQRFGQQPEYTAAGGFAIGLVLAECIRESGSLEDERLRKVAAALDFTTFYGKFRIDPRTGRQIGHRILLTQWRRGRKVVLGRGEVPNK